MILWWVTNNINNIPENNVSQPNVSSVAGPTLTATWGSRWSMQLIWMHIHLQIQHTHGWHWLQWMTKHDVLGNLITQQRTQVDSIYTMISIFYKDNILFAKHALMNLHVALENSRSPLAHCIRVMYFSRVDDSDMALIDLRHVLYVSLSSL